MGLSESSKTSASHVFSTAVYFRHAVVTSAVITST
jgi:hypothetical protein